MLRQKDIEENHHNYYYFDYDLKDFFSIFIEKDENFNNFEINNILEEELFFINPNKNILEKKKLTMKIKSLIMKSKQK